MSALRNTLLTTMLLLTLALPSSAALYVTDSFDVTLRSGPGTDFKIISMLKSGDALEFVEANEEGWFHVTTAKGVDGWIVRRYVTEEKPRGPLLAKAQAKIKEQKAQIKKLSDELGVTRKKSRESSAASNSLNKKHNKLKKEFEQWKYFFE